MLDEREVFFGYGVPSFVKSELKAARPDRRERFMSRTAHRLVGEYKERMKDVRGKKYPGKSVMIHCGNR